MGSHGDREEEMGKEEGAERMKAREN